MSKEKKSKREFDSKKKKVALKIILCGVTIMVLLLPLVFSRSITPLASTAGIKKYAMEHIQTAENFMIKKTANNKE